MQTEFDYNLNLNLPIFQIQFLKCMRLDREGAQASLFFPFSTFFLQMYVYLNVCLCLLISKKVLLRKRWCTVFLRGFLPAGSLYIYWLCESDYVITLMARNITTTLYTTIWQQQCWYCVGVLCGEDKLAFYCRTFLL